VNELVEGLKQTIKDEDARYVYADTVVNSLVSAQIKALRDDRKLSQQELADLIGTKQSGISRLEKADYSTWKIETLRKLARAFGVRLRISFDEFGTLPPDLRGFTKRKLCPRRFEDDPVFKDRTETLSNRELETARMRTSGRISMKKESGPENTSTGHASEQNGGGTEIKDSQRGPKLRMGSSEANISANDLEKAS
jgi:transcriptional regulator with XRE-family HTH domain